MAAKRKQDEKHLKMLREMVSLPHNKHCFDCHQRGPTYVNMTIGCYVCTACSGILRGINPPHRVKSISMTSFTLEETDTLKCHGNDFCRKVWLGLFDSRTSTEPDSKDEQKVRDFMTQKYEKKRWYVAPTDAMKDEARKQNEANKKPETRPLKTLLGNNVPKLNVQQIGRTNSFPQPPASSLSQPVVQQPAAPPPPITQEKKSASFDLLADFGADPFANSTTPTQQLQQTPSQPPSDNFANFESAFSNNFVAAPPPAAVPTAIGGSIPPSASFTGSVATSLPQSTSTHSGFGNAFTTPAPQQQTTVISPSTASTPGQASMTSSTLSDKYAALAELDNVFSVSGSATVDWDGKEVLPTAKNAGSSNTQPSSRWTDGTNNSNWAGAVSTTSNHQGNGWHTTNSASSSGFPSNAFSSAPNPFGGGITTANQQQPPPPVGGSSVPNPFLASSPPQSSGFNQSGGFAQFDSGQPAFGQFSSASTSGFSTFNSAPTNTQAQFGMQNGFNNNWNSGASSAQQPQSGFGVQQSNQPQNLFSGINMSSGSFQPQSTGGASFGGAGMAAVASGQFGKMGHQSQGFGQQPVNSQAGFASWNTATPADPSSNPFMNLSHQPMPPRANSTNPFL